nr:hypothetical protein HmN_000377800 [Hymenolepis microstoma]
MSRGLKVLEYSFRTPYRDSIIFRIVPVHFPSLDAGVRTEQLKKNPIFVFGFGKKISILSLPSNIHF